MDPMLAFIVVAHGIVITILVFLFLRRRVKLTVDVETRRVEVDFKALSEFTKEKHERIGEYVRANWSGDLAQLPRVLGSLVDELDRDVQSRGLALDREMLKDLVEASLRAHRVGRSGELRQAMRAVA